MANVFERNMSDALDSLNRVMGESTTFTYAAEETTQSITVVFNEFVGFVDNYRRAIFTARTDAFSTREPVRGDHFVLAGETARWKIVDVRNDQSGGVELRCDGHLERT